MRLSLLFIQIWLACTNKRDRFVIPLTCTFCGNSVTMTANLSPVFLVHNCQLNIAEYNATRNKVQVIFVYVFSPTVGILKRELQIWTKMVSLFKLFQLSLSCSHTGSVLFYYTGSLSSVSCSTTVGQFNFDNFYSTENVSSLVFKLWRICRDGELICPPPPSGSLSYPKERP